MKKLFDKKNRFILLMAVLLLPLFFVNVKSSHDWGGDFAMYIMQADNILHGIPQGETPYIYNPGNAVLGPPAYPVGFPLLLSPVYALAGNSIFAFTIWVTAFLFGAGMIMTFVLRRYFKDIVVLFLVLMVVYNPWTLSMKMEIMSEFAFTFLLLLSFYLFERYSKGPFWAGIIIAIIGGLLMSVRAIGIVFPLAVLFWAVRKRFIEKDKTPMNNCVCGFLVSVGSILIYLLLNNLIFNVPQAEGGSYFGIWGEETIYATVVYNLAYYVEQFKYFFSPWGGSWNFLPLMLKAAILTFTILGLIKAIFRRWELMEMIVVFYIAVLLLYPYRHAGIRFLFPLMPFLMYYLVEGLKTVQLFPKISIAAKTWFLGSLVLVTYLNMIWFYIITADNINPGPQEEASIQAFEHIKNTTSDDAVFLFSKPRVLALYTERQCLANSKNDNDENISGLLKAYEIDYILVHQEISDEAIKRFINDHQEHLKEEYRNTKFILYKNLSGL
jgi:hypothetical protein